MYMHEWESDVYYGILAWGGGGGGQMPPCAPPGLNPVW